MCPVCEQDCKSRDTRNTSDVGVRAHEADAHYEAKALSLGVATGKGIDVCLLSLHLALPCVYVCVCVCVCIRVMEKCNGCLLFIYKASADSLRLPRSMCSITHSQFMMHMAGRRIHACLPVSLRERERI
jgi:hypothetical protein